MDRTRLFADLLFSKRGDRSKTEMARLVGVTCSRISSWEGNSSTRVPEEKFLGAIFRAYGIDLEEGRVIWQKSRDAVSAARSIRMGLAAKIK